jgi:DNA-directed RNA polymerase
MPYAEIESDLVCHQDGTCNGLQHGAAITGHRATAEAVNCTASTWTDAVSDVYRLASEVMLAELEKHDLPMVTAAVRGNGRNLLKLPIMVTGYGAGIVTACADFNTGLYGRALPESIANRQIIQDCMTVALETHAGAMITLTAAFNEATKNLWQDAITWTTQDGFHAVQYNSAKKERIVTDKNGKEELKAERTYAGAGSHTIRTDKNEANESAQICAVSPNFIHSIDATHLRAVIRKCNWDLVTVHDSIGSHAAHYFATNKHVRDTFASVHTYEWLANFNLNQGSDISVNMGDYSAQEAVQSTYLFS